MSKSWSIEQLAVACSEVFTIADVLRKLYLLPSGGNYKTIKQFILKNKIDISHFTGRGHHKGKSHSYNKRNLFEVLVENSSASSHGLKLRLIKEQIFDHKCYKCGSTKWNDLPISLELEHKNGNHSDNRLENLTLLCPNCHSQTITYRGKNKKKYKLDEKEIENFCIDCNQKIHVKATRCMSCAGIKREPTKIQWPSKEELQKLVWQKSTVQVAKDLGISDKAIEKHCKKLNVNKPPRGYWAKIYGNEQ